MNSRMAWWVIDQLVQQGVSHICLAPGSRSTPLALAAANHKAVKLHIHYDERGLGFYALGLGLATKVPAAVIVTSGTAVGNLLPSVMESFHSHTPLILLTADRPPDLLYAGANQTCDQLNLFGHFVRGQIHLPTAESQVTESYVRSSIAHGVCLATEIPGAVHINWHIREPLFTSPFPLLPEGKPIKLVHSEATPKISTTLSGRGVIAVGKLPSTMDLQPILTLAKKLRWPVFGDILSEARFTSTEEQILHFDWILKEGPIPADTILHFGDRLTAKTFLSYSPHARRIHVSPWTDLQDPTRLLTERIIGTPRAFCRSVEISPAPIDWLAGWKQKDRKIQNHIRASLEDASSCTEPHSFYALAQWFREQDSLYLGSGMPIRDADYFFFPPSMKGRLFSNRGLSGIDGNIATAAGLAEGLQSPLVAWIGDQAALHDLNSLPMLGYSRYPILLIVSNNFGGGIFSHLPEIPSTPHFETLFANAHSWNFAKTAEQFHLPYYKATSVEELICLYKANTHTSGLIELITSRELNYACHRALRENLQCKEPIISPKLVIREPTPEGMRP